MANAKTARSYGAKAREARSCGNLTWRPRDPNDPPLYWPNDSAPSKETLSREKLEKKRDDELEEERKLTERLEYEPSHSYLFHTQFLRSSRLYHLCKQIDALRKTERSHKKPKNARKMGIIMSQNAKN